MGFLDDAKAKLDDVLGKTSADEQAQDQLDSTLDRTTLDERAQDAWTEHGDKLDGVVDQHADRIDQGIDQGSDFINDRTGGRFGEQLEQGEGRLRDGLDSLDGKDDDFPNA